MAELELSEKLDTLVHRNVSFAHGTVLALNGGVLLYLIGGPPNNLLAFCFSKRKPILNSKTQERSL